MTEELWTGRCILREVACETSGKSCKQSSCGRTSESLFQVAGSALRHSVPEFGSPKVNIIDTEEVHVLDMPGKGRTPHAKVEVGCIDAWKSFIR